jgi:small subunit ribosomal protein S4
MVNAKCKICRRSGQKLFLKGEKCNSTKCPMIKKAYPPGSAGKRRRRNFSEYSKELREKQRLRNFYNLGEKQFRQYVNKVLERMHNKAIKEENPAEALIRILERRFDNVVYRLGFADSRVQARQLVNHGHFFLNNKPTRRPSAILKKGDKISIRQSSQKSPFFTQIAPKLKKYQVPSWLILDKDKVEGEIKGLPTLEESAPPAEISSIFEFYSR